MKLERTPLDGLWVGISPRHADERGSFERAFDLDEFEARGLQSPLRQVSISRNPRAGTLRGLHLQDDPYSEIKLVRCLTGAVFDVAVDLRPGSRSYRRWHAVELSADNGRALYIPRGFAHGFQTLVPDTAILYMISDPYIPSAARGVRWDDPALAIVWPACARRTISERDRSYDSL